MREWPAFQLSFLNSQTHQSTITEFSNILINKFFSLSDTTLYLLMLSNKKNKIQNGIKFIL